MTINILSSAKLLENSKIWRKNRVLCVYLPSITFAEQYKCPVTDFEENTLMHTSFHTCAVIETSVSYKNQPQANWNIKFLFLGFGFEYSTNISKVKKGDKWLNND